MKHLVCESLQEFYTTYNMFEQTDSSTLVKQTIMPNQPSPIKSTRLKNGVFCLTSIKDNDAFHIPGQGIYIWTNESFLELNKDYFKVGQYGAHGAPKTPDETITGYKGTTIDKIIIVYAVKLDDYFLSDKNVKKYTDAHRVERAIHKKIVDKLGYHVTDRGTSTEIFGGLDYNEIIKIINGVIFNTEKLKSFDMRPEQKTAANQIVNNFKAGKKEFLLAAKMRYGKNFTFLNAAKALNYKNILVLTYKPQVFSSLKEDIETHVNFDGWKFVEFKNQRNLTASTTTPQVIVSSAQLAQYKSDDDKENEALSLNILTKNIKALKPIHFDLIVADEYHYGTGTHNFKELLKQLNYDHIIWISGTAMKDIQMGRFEDEDVFVWDYIDEQKKKREGSKAHQDMPTMEIHLMHIDERAKSVGNLYTPEEGFNMAKLISVKDDGTLMNEGSLEILLRQIAGTEVRKEMSPFRSVAGLNHTFWVLDKNVKGIKAMAALMRTMPEYKDCIILEATGDVVSNINTVKEKINQANNEGKRTITLSCYRFKEGVTVPEWNGVIMLDGGKSVEEYLQAIFRCQSPDMENDKQKCHVFDFNPQRCLSMMYDTCENIDKTGKKSLGETVKEFLDYAPILDHVNNKLEKVDFNRVIENFRAFGSFSEKFANLKNVNIEKIDNDIIQSLNGVQGGNRKKEIEVNDQAVQIGKTAIRHRVPKGANPDEGDIIAPSKNEVKKYLQKIAGVLSNIPEYLFNSPEDEKTVDDIINGKERELFQEITGVSLDVFKMWVDKKLINTVLLNRVILNFNDAEEKFVTSHPSLEDKDKFFNHHFNMRAESGATPAKLVNEMLDKLPQSVWNDPKKTFCDPVMGTGTFLIAIKERLNEGLKKSIPDTAKREAHIINNMLYGCDINQSKVNIAIKLLGNVNHITKEDSLTKKWNMKFDVIVGNPPYKSTLHFAFLKLCYSLLNSDGNLVFVQPSTWLISLKEGNHKEKFDQFKDIIEKYLESVDIVSSGTYFPGVDLWLPLSITYINKNKNTPGIKFNLMNQETKIVESIKDINLIGKFSIIESILTKTKNKSSLFISDFVNKNANKKYFVSLNTMGGNGSLKVKFYDGKERTFGNLFNLINNTNNVVTTKPLTSKPQGKKEKGNPKQFVGFDTKFEAENFLGYITKTKFVKFFLILNGFNQLVYTANKLIPWMDWNKKIQDEELYKYFNLSKGEINMIESVVNRGKEYGYGYFNNK